MRIAIVTGIFPPDHGGPASYVPRIASALQGRGHHIVATLTLSDRLDMDDRAFGFPVVRIARKTWRPLRWIRTILTIRRIALDADVVYLNGLVMEGIMACRLLARRPVVIKVVGDLVWEKARNAGVTAARLDDFGTGLLPLRWICLRWLQGWYTRFGNAVIVPSRYLASIVEKWGVAPQVIHVIYNAVEIDVSANTKAVPVYDIVSVARLVPWKGLERMIALCAEHSWRLRIVGDGPLRASLERLAASLNADVSFAGYVPQEQVAQEIGRGKIFVLNSMYEGLPHIVLEAKAAGVAVIASSAGGTPETIRHGKDGWLVPVADDAELASTISMMLADPVLRARIAADGQESIAAFSPQVMVDRTEAVLLATANPEGGPGGRSK